MVNIKGIVRSSLFFRCREVILFVRSKIYVRNAGNRKVKTKINIKIIILPSVVKTEEKKVFMLNKRLKVKTGINNG